MSSMRNAVQRRNHKERAQPEERKKWGLLEKRKDYKLRAADHRQKKAKLKILSEKARDRNPDEFSFKMMSSSVDSKGRKVADRGNEALSMDVVKLLKTQDAAYIRTMLQQVRRERQKLEERLVLEDQEVRALRDGSEERTGKHRVFVENEEEQEEFDADAWFGEGRAMPTASRPEVPAEWEDDEDDVEDEDEEEEHRPQKKTLSAKKLREQEEEAKRMKKFEKTRSRAQSRTAFRLQMVKKKERELVAAEEELEKQRAKMNSSVGGVNKNGVKFKIRERKR
ncbi:hypothetical protein E8E12_002632 [Didymella heteroderae]|uniref:U3 small nucleolar RNA-associated protein 11 n=1 Tax=Didymella heteroderae TaxID=1769908 RepID=A0A9P4WGS8_9PLEO|nr:hypothetical protein E8E12_002632 [Didymella heteroderae]